MNEKRSTVAVYLLLTATVVFLGPFLSKAFHIDDPLFIWMARQIQMHPLDPYGFDVNWYLTAQPMSEVMKNPPGAAYLIAAASPLIGWSEPALHALFLLPAAGLILGTWRLAGELSDRPILAGAIALTSPAFLISASSIMCDTLLVCAWTWSIALWVVGLRRASTWRLAVAALLIGIGAMTKYYAAVLVPLLVAYTCISRRRIDRSLAWMAIPIAILAIYQGWSSALYGRGLLFDAGEYAIAVRPPSMVVGGVTAMVFMGGLLPASSICVILQKRWWLTLVLGTAAIGAVTLIPIPIGLFDPAGKPYWGRIFEAVLCAAGGVGILVLAVRDVLHERSAASILLALWVVGTFVFAGFLNWTVNGRSILPMVPAVAILIARSLSAERRSSSGPLIVLPWTVVGVAGVLGLMLARADYIEANAAREAARRIMAEPSPTPRTVWFTGHWGFQFYMEAGGARPIDVNSSTVLPGDSYVIPMDNTNRVVPPREYVQELSRVDVPLASGVTIFRVEQGPGFYAGLKSVLPFVFESFRPDSYLIFRVTGWFGAPSASAGE